jgi:pyruvate dehydrogenase E1 component beta subunit
VVVTPATAEDNKGLLKSAIRSDDPVIYMEHKALWRTEGDVNDDPEFTIPFGVCRIARPGEDITIVTWSGTVPRAVAAADKLAEEGISAEVIDLRTLWPWDEEGVCRSVEKTGRLLIVHEAVLPGGYGAEIYASVHARMGSRIKSIARLGAPRIPIPFSSAMNKAWQIEASTILASAKRLVQS